MQRQRAGLQEPIEIPVKLVGPAASLFVQLSPLFRIQAFHTVEYRGLDVNIVKDRPGQIGSCQIGVRQAGFGEIRITQIDAGEICTADPGANEFRIFKTRPCGRGAGEIGSRYIGAIESRVDDAGVWKKRLTKIRPVQPGAIDWLL